VNGLQPVTKARRAQAILNGDFTPLHIAPVEFTTLIMPDGRKVPLHTAESAGLISIVPSRPAKAKPASSQPQNQNTGVLGTGKQQVQDAIHAQMDKVKSIPDLVRGPDKKERIEDYLMTKLPYHPQYVRKGTRFDAELEQPLDIGVAAVSAQSLASIGSQPAPATVVHARLITELDSASSQPGEAISAELAEPVYSADRKLILPEGTVLNGSVVTAKRARWFHRSGQLRFTFRDFQLPSDVAHLEKVLSEAESQPTAQKAEAPQVLKTRTEANLQGAESTGKAQLKVDREGGVQASESKTRFLVAAAAVLIARRAADNDADRAASGQIAGQSQNVSGRTLGGGLGFGLLGMGIAQSSRWVGTAFGYYGMGWALYSTLISRGSEVHFDKNATIDIRFDMPVDKPGAASPAAAAPAVSPAAALPEAVPAASAATPGQH